MRDSIDEQPPYMFRQKALGKLVMTAVDVKGDHLNAFREYLEGADCCSFAILDVVIGLWLPWATLLRPQQTTLRAVHVSQGRATPLCCEPVLPSQRAVIRSSTLPLLLA
jgi:hypothetical protein